MPTNLIVGGIAGVAIAIFLWRRNAPVKGCSDIDGAQLKEMLKSQKGIIIIDVRTPEEYKRGHIPGALSRPLGKLDSWSGDFKQDKSIVLVCASGARSKSAADRLVKKGYTQLFNLKGGMGSWQQ